MKSEEYIKELILRRTREIINNFSSKSPNIKTSLEMVEKAHDAVRSDAYIRMMQEQLVKMHQYTMPSITITIA